MAEKEATALRKSHKAINNKQCNQEETKKRNRREPAKPVRCLAGSLLL